MILLYEKKSLGNEKFYINAMMEGNKVCILTSQSLPPIKKGYTGRDNLNYTKFIKKTAFKGL